MVRTNKEMIAFNLLTCPTKREAAKKSGVSRSTLHNLMNDADFLEVMDEVKNSIFNEAMQKAQSYCLGSLEVLWELANDEDATDSSRVSAARAILELGVTLYEDENIVQRLEEMERRVFEGD